MDSTIARTIGRLVLPFIQVLGLYIAFHGHLSPGGGFAGGTVVGASLILALLLDIPFRGKSVLKESFALAESSCLVIYAMIGFVGIAAGTGFLGNLSAGFPRGIPGSVLSAGYMVPLGVAICLKVASTIGSLFWALAREDGQEDVRNA
ncbi:MAG: sodium:proton antiporter [Firmicutes bacterium]|nr:sodium:proton antiporter [Bacillota bacterium]